MAKAADFYQALTTPKGHRGLVAAFAQNVLVQRDLSAEELDWVVGLSTRSPCWVAAAYDAAGNFSNYQLEAEEVDLALPTLFIVDEGAADRAKRHIELRLPNARTEFFGGHMMFWEYPEKFNAVLEKFLRECET